jgi:hypothetical protein
MSAALCDAEFPYAQVIRVELPSAKIASIIHDTLAVDKELKPDRSIRNLRIEQGNVLVACVICHFLFRFVRLPYSNFCNFVSL